MSTKLDRSEAEVNQHDTMNDIDDALIDKVWRDLDRQLSREQVCRVVAEVALGYQNAKVKAFLPILIHREALEQLKEWLAVRSMTIPTDSQLQPDNEPMARILINS